jgi:hypothetical protein
MATRKQTTTTLTLTPDEMSAILADAAGTLTSIIRLRGKVTDAGLTDQHGQSLDDAFTDAIDMLKAMADARAANDSTGLMVLERRLDQSVGKTVRLARKAVRAANKGD